MKNTLHYLLVIFFAAFSLSSCGGGDSAPEIGLIPVSNGNEFQYIDLDGKIAINPQFSDATVFRDGIALVKTSGDEPKFGYINEDGKYAINAGYIDATVFSDGLAWVVAENAAPAAIDKNGEIKFTKQDAEEVKLFKNGLAAFSLVNEEGEEKWGFVDKNGEVVINPQFSEVENFSDGLCGVSNDDGKWGFIDKEGSIVINYQFDAVFEFKGGKCVVESNNKYGVIDEEGKFIINPQFDGMMIDGDMFIVEQGGKYGWCDKDGKIVINPQFAMAFPFYGNEITAVQSGKTFGYINKEGKIAINPQFEFALPFTGKLALVISAGKVGFIGRDGKYRVNPQFDDSSPDFGAYFYGHSLYSSVQTDYFNVGAITDILDFEAPEGFTFESTFEDVMKKNELEESDFSRYYTETEVSYKKISNDADYSFSVTGNTHDKKTVTYGDGWYPYTTTEYVFNGKNKPTAYTYNIYLFGKGDGKEDAVISAIKALLNGYEKSPDSDDSYSIYTDGKREILLYSDWNEIVIKITELGNDNEIADYTYDYEGADNTYDYGELDDWVGEEDDWVEEVDDWVIEVDDW